MNEFILKIYNFNKSELFQDLEDFFHRAPPCIFAVIVNRLCTVFLG